MPPCHKQRRLDAGRRYRFRQLRTYAALKAPAVVVDTHTKNLSRKKTNTENKKYAGWYGRWWRERDATEGGLPQWMTVAHCELGAVEGGARTSPWSVIREADMVCVF